MKKYSLLTSLLLILMVPALLQAQNEEQIEKFKAEKQAYFTEHLSLNEAEAEAFWPLYEDYENRKTQIWEKERVSRSYIRDNFENLTEEESLKQITEIHGFKREMQDLDEEYYQDKFLKALPAKKILRLQKVEMDYRRHLIGRLRGKGPQDGRGQGQGRGKDQSKGQGRPNDFRP